MRQKQEGIVDFVSRHNKLEYVFLALFIFFGCIFIYISPPGQNPDEFTHVYRGLQVADGHLTPYNYTYKSKEYVGGKVSDNVQQFFSEWGTFSAFKDVNFRFNRAESMKRTSSFREDKSHTTNTDFNNTAVYSPVDYAPQTIAIWLSRALNLSIYNMIILGRLFSLLTVAAALALSLRLLPIGKWAVFIVGLLPATVSQAAAFSADGMTISAVVLGVAYILKLALQKQRLSRQQSFTLLALCALIGIVKPSYIPIIAVVAVIPLLNTRARSRKSLVTLGAIVATSLIPFLLWMHQISFIKTIHSDFNPTANYYVQQSFVVHHPVAYGKILYRTFFTNQQPDTYRALFGDFGWNFAPLPPILAFLAVVLLTLSVLVQSPREVKWRLTLRQTRAFRALLIGVFLVCVLLVATAIYLSFNNVRRTSIDGVQGRYLTPPFILLLLVFYGNKLQRQRSVKIGMLAAVVVLLVAGVVTAYTRYYLTVPPFY